MHFTWILIFLFVIKLDVCKPSFWDGVVEFFNSENCSPHFAVRTDESALRRNLSNLVFGQPFVTREMVTLIAEHRREHARHQKPLVMSFHGSQGTGKNFVATIVVEHLFLRGLNSKFVHYFNARMHFTRNSRIDDDRDNLMYIVQTSLRQCPYSAFIFDELEKYPASILNDIKHIIDYNSFNLAGIDTRKALFIFLSNSGMEAINKNAYELWQANVNRNDFKYSQFKDLITEVYHAEGWRLFDRFLTFINPFGSSGALKHSELIESALIDFYVPFLPLQKGHVVQCIKSEARNIGPISNEEIDEVLESLDFQPEDTLVYSRHGCKNIRNLVTMVLRRKHYSRYKDEF